MSRVEIHAGGRAVIVDHEDLAGAERAARRLWALATTVAEPATLPAEPSSALGFVLERADVPTYADDCPGTIHTP